MLSVHRGSASANVENVAQGPETLTEPTYKLFGPADSADFQKKQTPKKSSYQKGHTESSQQKVGFMTHALQ